MNQKLRQVWRDYSSSLPLRCFQIFIPSLLFLCIATTSSAAVIDVTRWGARPNDSGDDSAAIQRAINAAPDGSTIYFPEGTYLLCSVQINNRRGLTLSGDGSTLTILRHHGRYPSIFLSTGSMDMRITQLGFDTNGLASFGGSVFYNAKRITITKNHFFDSNRQPVVERKDRYSWVFGRGSVPSEDILISDNLIEDLQLEVDFSRKVRIEGNTIVRPVVTAGIGVFTLTDNSSAQDYTIQKNTIVDPPTNGIVVHLDPPRSRNATMKTFRILDNHIVYTRDINADHASAIKIGTGDRNQVTTGTIFDDFIIENNVIYKDPGSPHDFVHSIIFGNSSSIANFQFDNTNVSNNVIYHNRLGTRSVDIQQKGVNYLERNNRAYGISSDIMPPAVPTAVTNTYVSDNQIHLTWNASVDNIGVDRYRIYRNGLSHAYNATTSYVDRNLQPGNEYTYTVTAIDWKGNESSHSHPVTASTTAMTTSNPVPTPTVAATSASQSHPVTASATAIITSNPVPTPTVAQPTLTATPASIPGGGTLTATWSGIASPSSTARIGLYRRGAANTSHIYWIYVNCSQRPGGSPRASGSCPLRVPSSLPSGTYELRLFNSGHTRLATSNGFTTTSSLTAGPTSIPAGGTLTATWKGTASPTPREWIGLYRRGAPNDSYIDWIYVSCSKTPGGPRASGSCPLRLPVSLSPGGYELRLFTNRDTTLAISNILGVKLGQARAW